MTSFSLERKVDLPVQKLWNLIADFTVSPGPEIKVEVEKEGDADCGGVGTIRTITIGNVRVKEILDSVDPPRGFTYRILSGAPMRYYKGIVNFKAQEGATLIRWYAEIKPLIPFTGPILVKVAKGAVNGLIDSVIKNHT